MRTRVLLPCLELDWHTTVTGKLWEFRGSKGIDLLAATHSSGFCRNLQPPKLALYTLINVVESVVCVYALRWAVSECVIVTRTKSRESSTR